MAGLENEPFEDIFLLLNMMDFPTSHLTLLECNQATSTRNQCLLRPYNLREQTYNMDSYSEPQLHLLPYTITLPESNITPKNGIFWNAILSYWGGSAYFQGLC